MSCPKRAYKLKAISNVNSPPNRSKPRRPFRNDTFNKPLLMLPGHERAHPNDEPRLLQSYARSHRTKRHRAHNPYQGSGERKPRQTRECGSPMSWAAVSPLKLLRLRHDGISPHSLRSPCGLRPQRHCGLRPLRHDGISPPPRKVPNIAGPRHTQCRRPTRHTQCLLPKIRRTSEPPGPLRGPRSPRRSG